MIVHHLNKLMKVIAQVHCMTLVQSFDTDHWELVEPDYKLQAKFDVTWKYIQFNSYTDFL